MIFVLSFIYNRQIAVNGYYSENIGGRPRRPGATWEEQMWMTDADKTGATG